MSFVRGIRGAITVQKNTIEEIVEATEELLKKLQEVNKLKVEDIVTVANRYLNSDNSTTVILKKEEN